ncbi:MAG: YcjF family protein [Gemmatimonadetes bacterium]|nr:YcjF family protein [Gemmatimonadota bacterium]
MRLVRRGWRHFRWGIRLVVAGTLVLLAAQLASVYRLFYDVHPWAGLAAAVAFAGLLAWLVAWPVVRLIRVPRAVDPPRLPALEERDASHVGVQLKYLRRYLDALGRNPQLLEQQGAIAQTRTDLRALEADCRRDPADANRRISEFENERVLPLLEPLDKQADAIIRKEALAIGSLTALSHMGTVDAFLVLWRDVNLVATISRIYYGRPGLRGTWHILRDVGSAILLSSVLEQISHMGTGVVRKMGEGGRHVPLVGAVVGPLLDGTINALMTMKIGTLAKERCRSFQAWDPVTTQSMVRKAFRRVGDSAASLASELNDLVGSTLGAMRAGADLGKEALVSFSSRTVEVLRGLRRGIRGSSAT